MNIQLINTKNSPSAPLQCVGFGSTTNPKTLAERTQVALRVLYHRASDDGNKGVSDIGQRVAKTRDALAVIFKSERKKVVNKRIIRKLKMLYQTAFFDAQNSVKSGWANATMIRLKIANSIKSQELKNLSQNLKANVSDDLRGDY